MNDYKISKEDIWNATENGKSVILDIYPQSEVCFQSGGRRNFKIRPDDKNPSCAVFQSREGVWMVQDKGGSDTRAMTAIQLVMREQNLDFGQAVAYIAEHYAPQLLEGKNYTPVKPKPDMQEMPAQDGYSLQLRESGVFTEKELGLLGWQITPERCAEFGLKPLDAYITPRNKNGKSYRISANENYPMYYYDYGTRGKEDGEQAWGKIYQPLGDLRFMYYGNKVENFIFGDLEFIDEYQAAKKDPFYKKKTVEIDAEGNPVEKDGKWEHLVICSGPSDALNVRNASTDKADYHVCWLNSETAELTEYEFSILQRLAKNIYILYDIDETGIANMYRIALRYLDIKIILLPSELSRFKDRKGKPCKDAKDFFTHFRRPENQNPRRLFDELVTLAGSLKFWKEQYSKKGVSYDINNEQLYAFLRASGYFRIPSDSQKKGYTFCKVDDNVVRLIDETAISSECAAYLLDYIKTHPKYYSQELANTVYRSKQTSLSSLEHMHMIKPDFTNWNATSNHFFFKNGIFKVSKTGTELVKAADCPCMVYSDKITDFNFSPMEKEPGKMPFFDIEYTEEYREMLSQLQAAPLASPEYNFIKKEIDTLPDTEKYRVIYHKRGFSFMEYLFNTGKVYWRKVEVGLPLTEEEEKEQNLHFISKAMVLGYLLDKYKEQSKAYAVFCMELEQSEVGDHLGGTGKSLFASSIKALRKQVYIDGYNINPQKGEFLLQGVERGITDNVFLDDLSKQVDLHKFMPMITGDMVVNPKYVAAFTIDYDESPKVIFTSNHAINGFDASLRRRTWFCGFSDYYHAEDMQRGLKERSPFTEFGKNLIKDYTDDEMNQMYNFLFNCLAVWMKLRQRIQPPMKDIEKRNLQRQLTEEFLAWADTYFTDTKLNTLVDISVAFEAYKAVLPPKAAMTIRPATFKKKLIQFCTFKEWIFNPDHLKVTTTDKEYNRIHKKVNGEDVYYFYIDTSNSPNGGNAEPAEPAELDLGFDNDADDDKPIF